MGADKKQCPFCGEEILAIASKCKHCRSNLDSDTQSATATQGRTPVDYGPLLLGIPVVASLLIIFWVSNMNLFQSPSETILGISVLTIISTAIVAAIEAQKLGMRSDRSVGSYSPAIWFFLIALLWIVGYPAYLYKRKKWGAKNMLIPSLLIAAIFLSSAVAMEILIEQKKAEIRAEMSKVKSEMGKAQEHFDNAIKDLQNIGKPSTPQAHAEVDDTLPPNASPCVKSTFRQWREKHEIEIEKWCSELQKNGEECRVSAGQETLAASQAIKQIETQCAGNSNNNNDAAASDTTARFMKECIQERTQNGIKLGGMSKPEAQQFATSNCADDKPTFEACMSKGGKKFDICFREAAPTSE